VLSAAADRQTAIRVEIFQCERELVRGFRANPILLTPSKLLPTLLGTASTISSKVIYTDTYSNNVQVWYAQDRLQVQARRHQGENDRFGKRRIVEESTAEPMPISCVSSEIKIGSLGTPRIRGLPRHRISMDSFPHSMDLP
jgi:hypothetical protein